MKFPEPLEDPKSLDSEFHMSGMLFAIATIAAIVFGIILWG
jgi:hypothetical protein